MKVYIEIIKALLATGIWTISFNDARARLFTLMREPFVFVSIIWKSRSTVAQTVNE